MIDLSIFFDIQQNLINLLKTEHRRSLYDKINWDSRLIGLIGNRGTGKTTLLLQYLTGLARDRSKFLYLSADHIRVEAIGIYDIASQFFKMGGMVLVIDEVHKYGNWPQEIKNLYDAFPNARILFSGSSSLEVQLGKADLSRRAVFYTLPGLSFREYLLLINFGNFPAISFRELLENNHSIASSILKKGPILGHFQDYLDYGVYPFFLEGKYEYIPKLQNVIEKVLYEDLASSASIRTSNIPLLKRILWLIATSQPFEPNFQKISRNLGLSKPTLYTYFDYLERAGLILFAMPAGRGAKLVRKPAKIYMGDTNLLRAAVETLVREDPLGTRRETFCCHQLKSAGLRVRVPEQGDFLVENRFLFEVGGRSKGKRQIATNKDAYLVRDDIDCGFGNVIPLWMLGMLY
jgi:predicted AAA+ superfamily ATPase